jgi:uncharacterized protein (TIGR03643 family)
MLLETTIEKTTFIKTGLVKTSPAKTSSANISPEVFFAKKRNAENDATITPLASPNNAGALKVTLSAEDVSRIIEMAWEDRTPFEAIETQFGIKQDGIIKLMRKTLKLGSFKLWRARTHGQTTKHAKLRSEHVTRHKANHRVKQF